MQKNEQTLDYQQLVQQCIKGEAKAQRNLYDMYAKAMYHTIVRMVAFSSDAEDILQDSFIKVFQNLDRFEFKSTLGAWIKRICINTTLKHIRKNNPVDYYENEKFPQPEEVLNEKIEYDPKTIHNAIKRLPQGCRTVINLYLFEGFKHKEIAATLNISESTSKSQYQRGRILLQKELKSLKDE